MGTGTEEEVGGGNGTGVWRESSWGRPKLRLGQCLQEGMGVGWSEGQKQRKIRVQEDQVESGCC